MTSRRGFLGFIASLPFIDFVPRTKRRIFGGGIKKFDYSQLYCSPESLEDIRNWGIDQIDGQTRKEIYSADTTNHFYGVNKI